MNSLKLLCQPPLPPWSRVVITEQPYTWRPHSRCQGSLCGPLGSQGQAAHPSPRHPQGLLPQWLRQACIAIIVYCSVSIIGLSNPRGQRTWAHPQGRVEAGGSPPDPGWQAGHSWDYWDQPKGKYNIMYWNYSVKGRKLCMVMVEQLSKQNNAIRWRLQPKLLTRVRLPRRGCPWARWTRMTLYTLTRPLSTRSVRWPASRAGTVLTPSLRSTL